MKHQIERHKVIGAQQRAAHCIVCGKENPVSFGARFFNLEDNKVAVELNPTEIMQSFPDRMHGGIVSTILDELLNRTILQENPRAISVTIELSIKFRKAIPLDRPMRGISWIVKQRSRTYDAEGILVLEDGNIAAEAFGRFAIVDPQAVGGKEGVEYYFDDDRPVPEYIDI